MDEEAEQLVSHGAWWHINGFPTLAELEEKRSRLGAPVRVQPPGDYPEFAAWVDGLHEELGDERGRLAVECDALGVSCGYWSVTLFGSEEERLLSAAELRGRRVPAWQRWLQSFTVLLRRPIL